MFTTSPVDGIWSQRSGVAPATPAAPAQPAAFAQAVAQAAEVPPPEVLAELDAAAVVAAALDAGRRQLHFEVDERTGALEVEVRDAEGHVVRRIPPTEALRVAMGAPIDGAR